MYTIFTILLPTLAAHTKYMMISMIDLVVHLLIYWGISYTVFSSRDLDLILLALQDCDA